MTVVIVTGRGLAGALVSGAADDVTGTEAGVEEVDTEAGVVADELSLGPSVVPRMLSASVESWQPINTPATLFIGKAKHFC